MITLLLFTLSISQAGQNAFKALHEFESILKTEAAKPNHVWPTPDEKKDIEAKIAIANECISDSMRYNGEPVTSQLLSMLRSEVRAVAAINNSVGPTAPKNARKSINKVQDAFAKLLTFFPIGKDFYADQNKEARKSIR